jgi:Secretion system C-terminal sorting domain/Fibronectin type III domain
MFTKQLLLPITWLRFFALGLMLLNLANTTQAQNCSQPSNLNSTVLASGTVALNWSASGGALTYTVRYRLSGTTAWINGGTVATTNQVLTGLLPEAVYQWSVRANCSSFSSIAVFNTGGAPGGNTACSQPSNQLADVTSPTTATLSWSAVEGALYYTVQYRLNNLGAWTNGGSVTGTSINISNLALNSEYGWRVKASCSVYSSVALFNTGALGNGGNSSCSQPSNTEALLLSSTSAELSWSAVPEASGYTVQYRQGLAGAWTVLPVTTATSLVLTGLLPATEYSWQVKASCSDFSSQAVFTTPGNGGGNAGGGGGAVSCSSPSNTNTLGVTPTTATVEWEANPEALNYTLQYKLELGGSYVTVGTFTTATGTITGLLPNTQYVWRVKANCSPYGSDVQFTTPAASAAAGNGSGAVAFRESAVLAMQNRVFPNPATADAVQILTEAPGAQLQIFNSAGVPVTNLAMTDIRQELNVSNWKNGLYFVQIRQTDGSVQTIKLVVAH